MKFKLDGFNISVQPPTKGEKKDAYLKKMLKNLESLGIEQDRLKEKLTEVFDLLTPDKKDKGA